MSYKILFTILLLPIILLIAKCSQNDQQDLENALIIGTNAVYAPYEYVNSTGQIEGFDIDMAQAIADKLEKKLIIKETTFDALILSLKQKKIDLVMSGMSITSSRKKEIAMIPYQGKPIKSLMLAFWENIPEGITSLEDIKNSTTPLISVQVATFQNDYLNAVDGVKVKSLEGNAELIMDIKYGKSLAALFEPHIASAMKMKFPQLTFIEIPLKEKDWVLGNGIGIEKNNTELIAQITNAVNELKMEGIVEQLENKWFGEEQ